MGWGGLTTALLTNESREREIDLTLALCACCTAAICMTQEATPAKIVALMHAPSTVMSVMKTYSTLAC